jgi:hypothetical protein
LPRAFNIKAMSSQPTIMANRPLVAVALLAGLLGGCLGRIVLAPTASAAPFYTSSKTLSAAGQIAHSPQVAIDGSSRATVVWSRWDGSNWRIQSVRLTPDGTRGPRQTLSAAGHNARAPAIAIDGSDRATIVWQRFDESAPDWQSWTADVQSVRLAADGTPGPVQTLSEVGRDASRPDVAIDGADRATIAWWWSVYGFGDRIRGVRLAADGTPAAVQTLSGAGQPRSDPQVAIDGSDRATVVWTRPGSGGNLVQSIRLAADGTPEAVQTLSEAGQSSYQPEIAIDGSDRAAIAWRRYDGSSSDVQSIRLAADGTPEAVQTLSGGFAPQVAIDGSDRATIVWYAGVDNPDGITDSRIQSVRLAADGTPEAVQTLSAAGQDADDPEIAIDGSDRATVVWRAWEKGDLIVGTIQSIRLAAAGTPGSVQTLSETGQPIGPYPQLDIDGSDRATIVWSRSDGTNYRIEAVTVDARLKGSAAAKKTQRRNGRKIAVKAKVKAQEDLVAKGNGQIKVHKRSYALRPITKTVSSGKSKTLKLKPKKSKDAKKIAKALKKGKKAKAKLTVKLTDEAGNKKTTKLSVKLKR